MLILVKDLRDLLLCCKESTLTTTLMSSYLICKVMYEITGARPCDGKVGKEDVGCVDMAYRVVADHSRTLSFEIADGAVLGSYGRDYVLRHAITLWMS